MNVPRPMGRVLLAFLATVDNLHPTEKVDAPGAGTLVPLAASALLKEEAP